MSKTKESTFELWIKCQKCGSSNIKTGRDGYHCGDCGSFELNFGGDEVSPSGKKRKM